MTTRLTGSQILIGDGAAAVMNLICGDAGPRGGVRANATRWFADQDAAQTGGELTIDVNWGNALFSDKVAVRSIRDGVADLGSGAGSGSRRT